jgi:sugar-specific transcriptional regulator TrmB
MTFQEEDIQTLVDLGLTNSQAKVYLTLITYGKMKGRTIGKSSGVARQDIYRVLDELQEKGLVEKIIMMPTEYQATPIEIGMSILLRQKAREYQMFEKKTKCIQKKFQAQATKKQPLEESQFSLISEKDSVIYKFKTAFDSAQKSVEGIFFWKGFCQMVANRDQGWNRVLANGVNLRFIIHDYNDKEKKILKAIENLNHKGAFAVRFTAASPLASMSLFDREKILITTAPSPFPADCTSLWLENLGLAMVVGDYFDMLWEHTSENPITLK